MTRRGFAFDLLLATIALVLIAAATVHIALYLHHPNDHDALWALLSFVAADQTLDGRRRKYDSRGPE